jgi:decaprenylphospho-beta-D-erythro-pentofuranosid-2-ulose 2-reductase
MKNILIIGATSTIAQECAKSWSNRGYKILLIGRNQKKLKKIVENLRNNHKNIVEYFSLDLNELSNHVSILNEVEKILGYIDIVLIAHGTLPNQQECETNVKLAIKEIKNNIFSTISILMILANYFEKNKKEGTIAVISSVAGDRGRASNYVYGSMKSMISTFASGLRQRLQESNVNVLLIKPGPVDTPMTQEFEKGIFWSKPLDVANDIIKAIDNNKTEIYTPGYWRAIMFVIKNLPEYVLKKINL